MLQFYLIELFVLFVVALQVLSSNSGVKVHLLDASVLRRPPSYLLIHCFTFCINNHLFTAAFCQTFQN